MRGAWGFPVVALCALVWVAGCGTSASFAGPTPISPDARVQTEDGRELRVGDLRNKVVVMGFFASWCKASLDALAALEAFRAREPDSGLLVIAIDVDEDRDTMLQTVRNHGISLPVAADTDGSLAHEIDIPTIPAMVVLDREGTVRFVRGGYHARTEIAQIEFVASDLLMEHRAWPGSPTTPSLDVRLARQ